MGASGDLAPLSHLALGLLGEGEAWSEEKGSYVDAGIILKEKGLEKMIL